MSQYSKLDLFRREVDTQVTILQQVLSVLKTTPTSVQELDQATQSSHSLWGTAQIIELDIATELSQGMNDCFVAAQNQHITLGEEQIEMLIHCTEILSNLSQIDEENLAQWTGNHAWDLSTTNKALIQISGSARSLSPSISISEVTTSQHLDIAPKIIPKVVLEIAPDIISELISDVKIIKSFQTGSFTSYLRIILSE